MLVKSSTCLVSFNPRKVVHKTSSLETRNKKKQTNKEVKAHFLNSWLRLQLLLPPGSNNKRLPTFDSSVCKTENLEVSHHIANTGFKSANVSAQITSLFFCPLCFVTTATCADTVCVATGPVQQRPSDAGGRRAMTSRSALLHCHHRSLGKILINRIMLMKVKETRINMSHSSQLTDFLVCCSSRSDSVFSFSKFRSA